jgi:hypothetical protein
VPPEVVPDDLVVERVLVLVAFERSIVRPPSVYFPLETVAVRVLTRVALRVVLPVVDRVAVREAVVAPEPEVRPTLLRPTRTPRSIGSPSLRTDRVRS